MTPDAYRRAGILFDQLRLLPEEQRAAILDAACAENPELRRQVLLLLRFDEEAAGDSFLERRAIEDAARLVTSREPQLPEAGTMIGIYRLGRRIGAGGMGVVFEAEDTRLQRRVAVKVLPLPIAGEGPERVRRFQQEARAISLLNHPNIVSIFDAGCEQQFWYIATEFIDGLTLRERMAAGPIEFDLALDIAIQAATALAAAHHTGVLHRDIKPENLMLRPDGVVKLVDFGLARVAPAGHDPEPAQTRTGLVVGTPRYMAPEQARGLTPDARTDVFSLGAVVYEMTTGTPAFAGASTAEVLAALLTEDANPPSDAHPELPEPFDPVIARALAKDPAERYPTAGDFAAALRGLKQEIESRRQVQSWRESRKPVRRAATAVIAAAFLAVTALAWRQWSAARGVHDDEPRNAVPLTTFAGYKDFSALSPDGRRFAYSWNGGQGGSGGRQERNIYVERVSGGERIQLTDSAEDNLWPTWSPDGRQIAFARAALEGRSAIYIVPASGGPERKVAADVGNGLSWSPDGKSLALVHSWPGDSAGIFLLSLESGEQRELTRPSPAFDSWPSFSPDGRWIAFTRGLNAVRRDVWIMPAAGGTPRQITFADSKIRGITWTADSREVVLALQGGGFGGRLWRVPIEGGEMRRVAVRSDDAASPNVPRGGDRLTYTESFLDTNIYRYDGPGFTGRSGLGRFGARRGLILSSREDHSPAFSSDGQWIVFVSNRSGNTELWLSRHDGAQARQLTSLKSAGVGTPRWSPDGRWIAFDCVIDGVTHVYVLGVDGGTPRRITTWDTNDLLPAWSPDGKWIYFVAQGGSASQLWRVPSSGGAPTQMTTGGIREPWLSPDGSTVYFTRRRPESRIWSVPADGGPERPVPELQQFNRVSRAWGVVRDGIYFISREDKHQQEVRFFSFATRAVSTIVQLDKEPIWSVPALALSPDGRTLLSVHLDHEVNDFMLVENWR